MISGRLETQTGCFTGGLQSVQPVHLPCDLVAGPPLTRLRRFRTSQSGSVPSRVIGVRVAKVELDAAGTIRARQVPPPIAAPGPGMFLAESWARVDGVPAFP